MYKFAGKVYISTWSHEHYYDFIFLLPVHLVTLTTAFIATGHLVAIHREPKECLRASHLTDLPGDGTFQFVVLYH